MSLLINGRGRGVRRTALSATTAAVLSLAVAGCGGDEVKSNAGAASGKKVKKVAVTLITKDSVNAFFVAMQKGAKEAATKENVDLTIASGKEDGDEASQITAIENAVVQGQDGILITPNGPGVNPAIKKARDAGLYVIALDTPPVPANTVDITFATDNVKAGQLIGQWTAKTMAGKNAVIALIDAFDDKIVATDYRRHNGFVDGMGIDTDANTEGFVKIPSSGSYDGGKYTVACQEAGQADENHSRTAVENCLNKNPDINVVYAINEPAAFGALDAVKAAGKEKDVMIVTIDGGCAALKSISSRSAIKATSQQYPVRMASLGMGAIAQIARGGEKPKVTAGLDFFNTGVELVSDEPADGVKSITSSDGSKICWGT